MIFLSCRKLKLRKLRLAADANGGNDGGNDGQLADAESEESGGEECVAQNEANAHGRQRSDGLDVLEARHGEGEERLERGIVVGLRGGGEENRERKRERVLGIGGEQHPC